MSKVKLMTAEEALPVLEECNHPIGPFPPDESESKSLNTQEWSAFSSWLTNALHGFVATLELVDLEGKNRIEVRDRAFGALVSRTLQNGVPALTLIFNFVPFRKSITLSGPQALTVHRNASGYPTRVDVEYALGHAILHFNSENIAQQQFTANSWGE